MIATSPCRTPSTGSNGGLLPTGSETNRHRIFCKVRTAIMMLTPNRKGFGCGTNSANDSEFKMKGDARSGDNARDSTGGLFLVQDYIKF